MLTSLVDSSRCALVKKRVYMPPVADEYSSSSQPLNAVVLASILSVMSPSYSTKKLRQGYIVDLAREGGVSPCALMLGLLYIKRLSESNPEYISFVSPRDLFLVSMVVASKYMNDEGEMEALTNSDWAKLGCMTKATLDELERNFLTAIDWRLYVPLEEYYTFVNSIEARIALDQASRRGWFTYTDLTAIWEATDLQSSMMLATKQTAKVAGKSAALYLMCVATLFAASGTLTLTSEPGFHLSVGNGAPAGGMTTDAGHHFISHLAPDQQMLGDESITHGALLNFELVEAAHRKKALNCINLLCCDLMPDIDSGLCPHPPSNDTLHMNGCTCVASSATADCIIVGGCDRMDIDKDSDVMEFIVSDYGTELESNESTSEFSFRDEGTISIATDPSASSHTTWAKFEDGLVFLLNLVASLTTLASSTAESTLSSPGSKPSVSSSPNNINLESHSKQSPGKSGSLDSIGPQNELDSGNPCLSTAHGERSSCHDGQHSALRNVAIHWWEGSNDSRPQTCFVQRTTENLTRSHSPQFNLTGPGKHHTVHCSQDRAVSMDSFTSRYTEQMLVTSSPKVNTGQVAVDLHWQDGGTAGGTDHNMQSLISHSTPPNFTLTENLLLYANSLLTVAL